MYLRSLENCELYIGPYPKFSYDARGGGGKGLLCSPSKKGVQDISFNKNDFKIPDMDWRTTKILGIPIPPGLKITINTEKLKGEIDIDDGQISLEFIARFSFSICSIIKAPDLIVKTKLNSNEVKSIRHMKKGMKVQSDGLTTLVGLSRIEETGNKLLDKFLFLPDEALAVLNCEVYGLKEN